MIEIRDIHKKLGNKEVLKGVSLTVNEGETVAILGRSGMGKSVLLKHMVGLMKPDRGQVIVDGIDITRVNRKKLFEIRGLFGFVFQNSALFDSFTVWKNVALPLIEAGYDMETIDRQVKKVLSMVNLEGTENLYPAELSGGMMKRVGIARALVGDPKYLLYDEPTAGLDPVIADRINDRILYLKEYLKKTAVVVTHDLRSALKVSDRIALLADGVIVTCIRKEEIFQVEHPEMRQFLKASGLS